MLTEAKEAVVRIREACAGKPRVNRIVMRRVKGKMRRCHDVSLAELIARDLVDVGNAIPEATRSEVVRALYQGAEGNLDRAVTCQVVDLDHLVAAFEKIHGKVPVPPPEEPAASATDEPSPQPSPGVPGEGADAVGRRKKAA